jgi:hypothetical protein
MNERIQELWNKAADSTAAFPSGQNNSWEIQVNFMEKFAELIISECIDIIGPYAVRMDDFDGGHPIADLKKHFGVTQ